MGVLDSVGVLARLCWLLAHHALERAGVCAGRNREVILVTSSQQRGHPIRVDVETGEWTYRDTGEPISIERPCVRCGEMPTEDGHDACLGHIEGLSNACCGHGVQQPYQMEERVMQVKFNGTVEVTEGDKKSMAGADFDAKLANTEVAKEYIAKTGATMLDDAVAGLGKEETGENVSRETSDEGPLVKVRLETADGHFVCTGKMPPFVTYPEVVVWGLRVFQLVTVTKTGEMTKYREVFCSAIVEHDFEE